MDRQSRRTVISGDKGEVELLRRACRDGEISVNEFAYRAACAYLSDRKPLRARRLLNLLDRGYRPAEGMQSTGELLRRIETSSPSSLPTCSLNMIVRNEECGIAEALDSVDEIMDEIVIVDTGSSDSTCSIARLYGATILHAEWHDDFSEARNKALEASSGDWIFWMDADDRVDAGSCRALRALWHGANSGVYAFCVANEKQAFQGPEFMQFRLFPRLPGIRFERPVHEQVVFSARAAGLTPTPYPNIRIVHTGYNDPLLHKKKARRNMRILYAALEREPGDAALRLSLGESHTILGEIDRALEIFHGIAGEADYYATHRDAYVQAHFNIGWLERGRGNAGEALRYLYRCLYLDASRMEAFYLIGLISLERRDIRRAFSSFVYAANVTPKLRFISAVDRRTIRMKSLYHTAEILLSRQRHAEARDLLQSAIEHFPRVVEYYSQMGLALAGLGRLKEAATYLADSLRASPERNPGAYEGLARIYLQLNDPEKAARLLLDALDRNSASAGVYSLMGDLCYLGRRAEPALEGYRKALHHYPNFPPDQETLLWKAASSALESGHVEEAREYLYRLTSDSGEDSRAAKILRELEATPQAA